MKNMSTEIMNTEQAGKLINRTPSAVRNLVLRRKIPFRKPAGRLVFLRSELEQWVRDAPGLTFEELKKQR